MASGVLSSNMYAFLDEDAPSEPKRSTKKEVTKKEAPKKESRKDTRPARAPREDRNGNAPRRDRNRDNGRRGGRGGGRGGRGKREFDRQSGTGRRDTQRRDGSGKFNWGAEGEDGTTDRPRRNNRNNRREREPKAEEGETATETPAEGEAAAATEGEAAAAKEVEPEAPKEVEPEVLGYDEYLAKIAENAPEEDKVEVREVQNDAFQTKAFTKWQEEDGQFENLVVEKANNLKKGKSKNKKEILSFDEFAASGKKDSRRGQRGDGRGRGRGRGRGNTLRLDESNFPKLG